MLTQALTQMAKQARVASRELATLNSEQKNQILQAMADSLRQQQAAILAANAKDVAAARNAGTSEALIDRLVLNEQRIEAMAQGFEQVIQLPDPIGLLMHQHEISNHLMINKARVPIGVITVIYESRPNVTA